LQQSRLLCGDLPNGLSPWSDGLLGNQVSFAAADGGGSAVSLNSLLTFMIGPGSPDFLWNLVALANFMRLSLLKGACASRHPVYWCALTVP
jgi:hypothetical protein